MSFPVSRTKVIIPNRRKDLFRRRRLLKYLEAVLECKLFIIAAPAGYGKSTLLIDFAHLGSAPLCWFSIDPLDQDPQRFIAHFIAALLERFPNLGIQPNTFFGSGSSELTDYSPLVTALTNEIYTHIDEHFILVLDDFHLVNDQPSIRAFINQFLREVGDNCHTVISSRTLIELTDMALMVARSEVDGLGPEELAFTPEELQFLVLQNYQTSIPDAVAKDLVVETEGWITGLLLSTDTMWKGVVDRLRVARVAGVDLYDFFAQQVLDLQTPEERQFLLHTSYLEEFDVTLCREVLGNQMNWGQLIQSIQKNILFVQPFGDTGEWVRYHHLFRDFLQARFILEQPEERVVLLKKISQVFAGKQNWDKAYAACGYLDDPAYTAKLIERAGSDLIRTGRVATLARWIESLPKEFREGDASLLSLQGVVRVLGGNIDWGLELLTEAEQRQRTGDDLPGLTRTLARRTVALRFRGEYEAAFKDAEEAILLSRESEALVSVHAESHKALGALHLQVGNVELAIKAFSESADIYHALEDGFNEATVKMDLGLALMNSGKYHLALDNFQSALKYWERNQHVARQANVHNNLAVLYYLLGEHQPSSTHFELSIDYARRSGYERMEAYALSGIGDLYLDLDAYQPAQEAYDQAGEIARRINYPFLNFYTRLSTCVLEILRGAYQRAAEMLTLIEKDFSTHDSAYDRGMYLAVSGRLALAEGRHHEAAELLGESHALFSRDGQVVEAARAAFFAAYAEAGRGAQDAVADRLGVAFTLAAKLDSQYILTSAARHADGLLAVSGKLHQLANEIGLLEGMVSELNRRIPEIRRAVRPRLVTVPFVPPKISIQALGSALVALDGEPLDQSYWRSKTMVIELFYYVLAHNRGLTKEELGLVFWPDYSQEEIRVKLKNTLYRLRQAVKQDAIIFEGDRYSFNRALDYEYDVEIFQEKLSCAEEAPEVEDKIELLREAIDLYQGMYLPEIEGSWIWPERERLWNLYSSTVLELAQYELHNGQVTVALEHCRTLLVADPCMEAVHRLAMQIHAARADRAALIRQYENCRQHLKEELGTEPSPDTVRLYETLINR